MLYKNDWDKARQKYLEFWSRENHDRPLISVVAPKDGYIPGKTTKPEKIEDRWQDTEYVIKRGREDFSGTFFGGEAFPALNPNLGPDIFGGILGCDLEFGEETSWSVHYVNDWSNIGKFEFNPQNKWWKKIKEMTEEVVKDSKGDYIVGITDLHPGLDGIVALRGPENVCTDFYDYPDEIKRVNFELLDIYKKVLDELYSVAIKNQEGSTNWMGIWHPGKWYVTSGDIICMISEGMFDEFFLPELLEEIKYLDASIFHLDGPRALKHLDSLLKIPELKGIQWVYGAGQPSASHWIHVLKKIQDAGKLIQVKIEPEEIGVLTEQLKPEGVMYITSCKSEQDAKDLIKKAEGAYKRKIF